MDRQDHENEFVAKAAHELRNPIAVVAASAELLERNWDRLTEELRREQVAVVASHARRLRELTRELLDWASLESGTIPVTIERVELEALLSDRLSDVSVAPDSSDISGVAVMADRDHLTRVLINLLTNAKKYGAPPVRLEASADGSDVVIRVIDQGEGIDDDLAPRLFEPFVRGSSEGTGLGLAIVRGLVEMQGGRVEYEARARGACFAVTLAAAGRGD